MARTWYCSLLLVTLASACGGRTAGDGSDSGGSGSGESGGDGDSAGTESGDGDGDGDVCEDLHDDPEGEAIRVRIVNSGSRPVFVLPLSECKDEYYELEHGEGYWPADVCDPTCAAMARGECACPPGCGLAPLIRLEVDGVLTRSWPSLMRVPSAADPACLPEECSAPACPRASVPEPGPYVARARVVRLPPDCDVDLGGDPALCDCVPNLEGWCEVGVQPGTPGVVEQPFDVPVSGPIEIVVQ